MLKPIELLKALFFALLNVFWTIIKAHWEPFYTTTVKMSITALVIWGLCQLVPHGLAFLSGVSYLGWLALIIVYRLLTIHYDDFDQQEDDIPEIPNADAGEEGPPEIQTELPGPVNNIVSRKELENNDTTESTRE